MGLQRRWQRAHRLVGRAAPWTGNARDADAERHARLASALRGALACATGSLTAPCAAIRFSGTPSTSILAWLLCATTASCTRAELPGTSVRRDVSRPPVHDSAAATVYSRAQGGCPPRVPSAARRRWRHLPRMPARGRGRPRRAEPLHPAARCEESGGSRCCPATRASSPIGPGPESSPRRMGARSLRVRFGLPGHADNARQDTRLAGPGARRSRTSGFHHGSELAWRTRQQHDNAPVVLEPQPGRRAIRVRDHLCPGGHHGLTPVDFRHLQPAPREARTHPLHERGVFPQGALQGVGHDVPRDVVVGRSEAHGDHHEIRPGQRFREHGAEVVPRSRPPRPLRAHADPVVCKTGRDRERVRVDSRRREQLAADRDDLRRENGAHAFRLQQPSGCEPDRRPRRDSRRQPT